MGRIQPACPDWGQLGQPGEGPRAVGQLALPPGPTPDPGDNLHIGLLSYRRIMRSVSLHCDFLVSLATTEVYVCYYVTVFLVILPLIVPLLYACDNFDGVHPFLNWKLTAFVFLSQYHALLNHETFFFTWLCYWIVKFSVVLYYISNFESFKAIAIL